MTDLSVFNAYVKRTLQELIVLTFVVTVILFLGGWPQYISGWLVGNGFNIIYFLMMTNRCLRALHLPPERIVLFIRGGALLRMFMIVVAVIIILQFPSLHFGAAIIGIFMYRVLIIPDLIYQYIRRRWRKER